MWSKCNYYMMHKYVNNVRATAATIYLHCKFMAKILFQYRLKMNTVSKKCATIFSLSLVFGVILLADEEKSHRTYKKYVSCIIFLKKGWN